MRLNIIQINYVSLTNVFACNNIKIIFYVFLKETDNSPKTKY